jgi:hypothetical protein
MSKEKDLPWWQYAIGITVPSAMFALLPFWTIGLSWSDMKICSMIIFPVAYAAFAFALWKETRDKRRP